MNSMIQLGLDSIDSATRVWLDLAPFPLFSSDDATGHVPQDLSHVIERDLKRRYGDRREMGRGREILHYLTLCLNSWIEGVAADAADFLFLFHIKLFPILFEIISSSYLYIYAAGHVSAAISTPPCAQQ